MAKYISDSFQTLRPRTQCVWASRVLRSFQVVLPPVQDGMDMDPTQSLLFLCSAPGLPRPLLSRPAPVPHSLHVCSVLCPKTLPGFAKFRVPLSCHLLREGLPPSVLLALLAITQNSSLTHLSCIYLLTVRVLPVDWKTRRGARPVYLVTAEASARA